ncbi:GNAT family N-acetyltransferase [Salininema proteolyticum]|uniref:GNAT family N-acetyltransferase n=1 Tax=Salininema proteolyticum TaxID=1607685 RepID=A0ABV8TU68_9ACTN
MRRPWNELAPVELSHPVACLRPVVEEHREALRELARDESIWANFTSRPSTDEDFAAFFDTMLSDQAAGKRFTFTVMDARSGAVAGSSAYAALDEKHDRLEIGASWLAPAFQGTGVNQAAKYLLLRHAFEVLRCRRVEFKTDVLNVPARRALESIGATEEGVARSFNYMPSGRRRDAVYYSVLDSEWDQVAETILAHPRLKD